MKKIKQVFPSRNYITIDSFGDVEVVFNPVGDGFEGDDKLMFRKGRWAFRVNDFLSGRVMPDGSKEGMGRKVYSLNLVYDDKDGEPIVNTTYVDPTSVIPLDGSVVDVVGSEKLAQENTLKKLAQENTLKKFFDFSMPFVLKDYPLLEKFPFENGKKIIFPAGVLFLISTVFYVSTSPCVLRYFIEGEDARNFALFGNFTCYDLIKFSTPSEAIYSSSGSGNLLSNLRVYFKDV